jgi:hypothetical protein
MKIFMSFLIMISSWFVGAYLLHLIPNGSWLSTPSFMTAIVFWALIIVGFIGVVEEETKEGAGKE